MIGLLEAAMLAGSAMALATWAGVSLAAPHMSVHDGASPRQREWSARLWLYAPLWLPTLLLFVALSPGVFGFVSGLGDHCLSHSHLAHLHHLCVIHPPHLSEGAAGVTLSLLFFISPTLLLALFARRARREWTLSRTLVQLSRPSPFGRDVRLLDRPEPVALTVGWRHPVVLLSTGLVAGVSRDTLDVVLAHERAHVARRDTWIGPVDRSVGALLPRKAAAALLGRITLAREQACDAVAAAETSGPEAVARALTETLRLHSEATPTLSSPGAKSGGPTAVEEIEARLRALRCASVAQPVRRAPWAPWALVAFGAALFGAGPVHSAVEHLVTLVLR